MSAVLQLPRGYRIVTDKRRIGQWVCGHTGATFTDSMQAIGNERDGVIIGGVLYDDYRVSSISMHCAGVGRWLTREFLRAVFDYPFNYLKVKKVIGLVDSMNDKAMRLDKHLGFVQEGLIKEASRFGDLVILTMTREQCRFLGDWNVKEK